MRKSIRALLCSVCIFAVGASASLASEALWQSYFTSATQADDASNYAEACKLYAAAMKEAESFGETDDRFIRTLRALADAYDSDARYDRSEPLFKRLLDIYEKNPKKNRMNIAWTLKALSHGYMCQAKFSEALSLQKQVLDLVTQETGANSRNVAIALDGLGRIYAGQTNFTEALPLYERSLTILNNLARAEKDPQRMEILLDNLSTGLRNAADAESYLGKYDNAVGSLQQSLAIQKKLLSDKENAMLASTYGSMATAYRRMGDYDQAEKLYKTALAIYERSVGPNHIDTAVVANGLAANYTFQNRIDEAELYYQRALATVEKSLGEEHRDVSIVCRNFGTFYFQQRDYPQAESLYRRALAIREKTVGGNHPSALNVVNDLARLYQAMGKNLEAKTLFQRLLTADEATYGARSPEVANDLNHLAEVTEALKKDDESRDLKGRAHQIEQTLPGAGRLGALAEMSRTISGATTASAPVKDKWALVVGISKFKDPSINLKYAAKDAIDFKNYLVSSAHFKPDHVKLLTDGAATRESIVAELGDRWLGRLANKDDLVVIYISSHGSTTKEKLGVNFLVAADTNKNALVATGIPMQWLSEIIKEQVHSDRVVLVMDVCHSGAATASGEKGLTRDNNFDVENFKVGAGQAVLCSSLADQVSWESKQYENSVFTRRLIEGLRKRGDQTSLADAYAHLRSEVGSEVLRDRGELQTPVLNMKAWTGASPVLSVSPVSPRPGMTATTR